MDEPPPPPAAVGAEATYERLATLAPVCGGSQAESASREREREKTFGHGFQEDDGLNAFLQAVTASEVYENFLSVMFSEVSRQAGETLEIVVPSDLGPGDPFQVNYLGVRYDLVVPDNHRPGDSFNVSVSLPPKLDMVSLFNVPDSFYGLD
eukprot:Skav204228  [mRNA]  locus=scaffold1550:181505:185391:- [translate_table: standard]